MKIYKQIIIVQSGGCKHLYIILIENSSYFPLRKFSFSLFFLWKTLTAVCLQKMARDLLKILHAVINRPTSQNGMLCETDAEKNLF